MFDTLRTMRIKALRDLWQQRSRTLMVSLSVAIGVLGVGMIVATWDYLTSDLARRYAAIVPAHVEIVVQEGVVESDLRVLARLPGVAAVQGRSRYSVRYRLEGAGSASAWQPLDIIAFPDPAAQTINVISPESGAWPPGRGQIVVERSSLDYMGASAGNTIIVDALGYERRLQIVGTAHQQDDVPTAVRGNAVAFVSSETMATLRGHDRSTTIYLTAHDLAQQEAISTRRPPVAGERRLHSCPRHPAQPGRLSGAGRARCRAHRHGHPGRAVARPQ